MIKPKLSFYEICKFFNISNASAHSKLKLKKVPSFKLTKRFNYLDHHGAKKLFDLKIKPTVIAFELVKGGVGKTSLSFHCGVKASLYGLKCLMIDLDQQANLTRSFGINDDKANGLIDIIQNALPLKDNLIKVSEGIDLLPSKFENAMLDTVLLMNKIPLDRILNDSLQKLKKNYDLIIIDCPPDLGATVTSAALASDLIFAPIEPDRFSLSGLELTLNEINRLSSTYGKNIPVRIILNKFNPRTNLSHQTLSGLFSNSKTKDLIMKSFVALSQEFPNAFENGVSLFDSTKKNSAKSDIDLLVRELIEMLKME